MVKKLDVIMPSWNNEKMKAEAQLSLKVNTALDLDFFNFPKDLPNLGWMGFSNYGLKKILDNNSSPYVLLVNDDILALPSNDWGYEMISVMEGKKEVGALGVLSNAAMGWAKPTPQVITYRVPIETPFISFFFVLLRKEAIKKTGFLDENLSGGDDLDYCFRLKKEGYKVGIMPKVFIWHYYAQTGKKIYGDYWDSKEYEEKINFALIRKHGFKAFASFK